MKKAYLLAALVATAFTSCILTDQGEGPATGSNAPVDLTIQIAANIGTAATRGGNVEDPGAKGDKNTINDGVIYILDASDNVYDFEALDLSSYNQTTATITHAFKRKVPASSKVFVIANLPTGKTVGDVTKHRKLDDLLKDYAAISTQQNTDEYLETMVANKNFASVAITAGSGTATVAVELFPVISRLELKAVRGTGIIDEFKVKAVYLFDYWTYFKFGGSYYDLNNDQTTFKTLANRPAAIGDLVAADLDGLDKIVPSADDWAGKFTATGGLQGYTVTPEASDGSGEVWAFNVAAGSKPMLVIELDDMSPWEDSNSPDAGPIGAGTIPEITEARFLVMTGYKHADLSGTKTFKPGFIYSIPEIVFEAKHIGMTDPTIKGMDSSEVTIDEWTPITGGGTSDTQTNEVTMGTNTGSGSGTVAITIDNNTGGKTTVDQTKPEQMQFPANQVVTFTATPATDMEFAGWVIKVGGTDISTDSDELDKLDLTIPMTWETSPTIVVTMPDADVEIIAIFDDPTVQP